MVGYHGRFVWHELMTTHAAAARDFYATVLGWQAQDASTPEIPYTLFSAEAALVAGLIPLPEEGKKLGASPRWMGYVSVDGLEAAVDLAKRRGGAIYVPPTSTNIGRIAVIADPQQAVLGLIELAQRSAQQQPNSDAPGQVGWNELLAVNWMKAFAFYNELFGWEKASAELGPTETYQLFSAGGETTGGIFTKRPAEPFPYWLYYFNVEDIDAAGRRVTSAGGRLFEGPIAVPEGSWISRCIDPQGAIFALQGKRSEDAIARDAAAEVSWSASWSGISSRGRVIDKPREGADRKRR
jgi:uncharacterized protein